MTERSRAEEILETYVESLAPGEEIDGDALCQAHPEHAEELRGMIGQWHEILDVLTSPAEEARGKGTRKRPSTISIQPKPSVVDGSLSAEVLERLQKRIGKESRYEILGEFARGGMGVILRVWDRDLRRTLAMKVVMGKQGIVEKGDTPALEERILGRFVEEAQVTGQLDHPGIVPVYELGVDSEGQIYFTMRLVKGMELGEVFELVREGRDGWTLTRAVGTILKVCETMAYAHSKGVIHRDLKPSNVMVGRFGEVYVMDWGLARLEGSEVPRPGPPPGGPATSVSIVRSDLREKGRGSSSLVTLDGDVMGTPAYMSPEQARGDLAEMGPASDVYSMGAILYHLLAGHAPYSGQVKLTPIAIWGRLQAGPPEPLSDVAADRPAELVAICEKAMARKPEDRYPTMGEMAEDLYAYVEGRVVRAHQTGLPARVRKWVGRNKALAVSLAGMILLAIGSLAGFFFIQNEALAAVRKEKDLTAIAYEQARRESYVANIIAADASLRAGEILEAKRRLGETGEELRGWEWRHLALQGDASLLVIDAGSGPIRTAAVSPDGRRIASSSGGQVHLWDLPTGKRLFSSPGHADMVFATAFRGERELLTLEGSLEGFRDGQLRTRDAETGADLRSMKLPATPTFGAALSHDGDRLAFGTPDGAVWVVELDDEGTLQLGEHESVVHAVAFEPGGRVLSGSGDGTIRLWNLETGDSRSFDGHQGAIYALAVSPSGGVFVSGSADGTVRRWSLDDQAEPEILWQLDTNPLALNFEAGGELLASAWEDKTIRLLEQETGHSSELFGHDLAVGCLAFVPRQPLLVSGAEDGTLRLWDYHHGGAVRTLAGPDFLSALAVRPDGELLAIGSSLGGSIRIVETDTGQPRAALGEDELVEFDPVKDLAFHPRGTLLAAAYEGAFVRIYRLDEPEPLHQLEHLLAVQCVAFHPDGKQLAAGSLGLTLWAVDTGEKLPAFVREDRLVQDIAFRPDGTVIAVAFEDGELLLYDMQTGENIQRLDESLEEVTALGWSPDGRVLAIGAGDHSIRFWNVEDGRVAVLSGHEDRVTAILFQGKNRMLSSSFDGTVRVWDVALAWPQPLLSLRGHSSDVVAVAADADGEVVISGAIDGSVRIWRALTR